MKFSQFESPTTKLTEILLEPNHSIDISDSSDPRWSSFSSDWGGGEYSAESIEGGAKTARLFPKGIVRFLFRKGGRLALQAESIGRCFLLLRHASSLEVVHLRVTNTKGGRESSPVLRGKRFRIDTTYTGTEFQDNEQGLLMIEELYPAPAGESYIWEINDPEVGTLKPLEIPGNPCMHFEAKKPGHATVTVSSALDGASDAQEFTVVKHEVGGHIHIEHNRSKDIIPQCSEDHPMTFRVLRETIYGSEEVPAMWESSNSSVISIRDTEEGKGEAFPGAIPGRCVIRAVSECGKSASLEVAHPKVHFKGPHWIAPNTPCTIEGQTDFVKETGYFAGDFGEYPESDNRVLFFEHPNIYPVRIGSEATHYFSEKVPLVCASDPIVLAHRRSSRKTPPDLMEPIDPYLKKGYLHFYAHVLPQLVHGHYLWGLQVFPGVDSYWVGPDKTLLKDEGEPIPFREKLGGSDGEDPFHHVFSWEFSDYSNSFRDNYRFVLFTESYQVVYSQSGRLPVLAPFPER